MGMHIQVSGLTLRTTEFRDVLRRWPGVVWGLLAILLVTPCLGFATIRIGGAPIGCTVFTVCPVNAFCRG